MAEYQKYMFDNFFVENNKRKEVEAIPEEEPVEEVEDSVVEEDAEILETIIEDTIVDSEASEKVEEPEPMPEPVIEEDRYSKEELDEAVRQAEKEAYEKGYQAASDETTQRQNLLLEDIKNQLMTIFAEVETETADMENSTLEFAVTLVRKLLPTLEKERAAVEVKNFLQENFANFAAQETLSFAFHPDTISLVADSIGRLAEQSDFEGKIAVHKDNTLGLSDCRVEWKNGGVERRTSKILEKVESLIDSNTQERENG